MRCQASSPEPVILGLIFNARPLGRSRPDVQHHRTLLLILQLTCSQPSGLPDMMQDGSVYVRHPSTCLTQYIGSVCSQSLPTEHTESADNRLTVCRYARTLYLPCTVGNRVSATNSVFSYILNGLPFCLEMAAAFKLATSESAVDFGKVGRLDKKHPLPSQPSRRLSGLCLLSVSARTTRQHTGLQSAGLQRLEVLQP